MSTIREILATTLRGFRRDKPNAAAFALFVAAMILAPFDRGSVFVFWVRWTCLVVATPLLGFVAIRLRRQNQRFKAQHAIMAEDNKHLAYWLEEVSRQSRELALLILSGKVGLAVTARANNEEQAEASAEVQHLHLSIMMENIRNAVNRHSREVEVVQAKWIKAGYITKEELEEMQLEQNDHGQKK